MLQDLRYALRFLTRRRGFTLVCVLTLALGVGTNTAIFSVADAVLFRPLPYAHRDRLFVLEPVKMSTGQHFGTMPVEDLDAARAIGAFDAVIDLDYVTSVFVREGDRLQALRVQPVPPNYLETLGVWPVYGRDFKPEDDGQNAVLLTYRTWLSRYGGSAAALDSVIRTVDGQAFHVVGVLPSSFRTASATAFFRPPDLVLMQRPSYDSGTRVSTPIARLAPGVSREAAAARLSAIHGTSLKPGDVQLRMVPLREMMGRTSSRTLTLLCAVAALVLLVGCANVANLVMARGAERERELAVRASLGASRWRIARLLLVENLAIAILGGLAGAAVAYWSFGSLVAALPASLARTIAPVFDTRVCLFAAATAMAGGLASAFLPAWRLARADARHRLQSGRLHTRPMRGGRKVLLSAEVMFALVAVVAALTLARSLWTLVSKELGFEAHRLVVSTRPVGAGAAQQTRPARAALFEQQFGAVRELPEVRSTAATGMLPAAGAAPDFGLFPRGQGRGGVWTVSAGFFRTMGIPVMQGREFEERESFEAAPVGVLNEAAARVLFPDGRAIGRQVSAPQQPARTIVGIVADARQSLKDAAEPAMYVPFDRTQFRLAQMIVDADDTPAVRDRIRSAITRVAADTDVTIEPVTALLNREVEVLRFTMALVTAFAALTLLLSILGIYGVITFLAGERIREYGVRVALGATERAIGLLVLRQAMPPIGAGILMGMLAAGWAAKLLESQILDVVPAGTLGLVTAAVVLLACGLAAAAIPALRATRVDPVVALRAE